MKKRIMKKAPERNLTPEEKWQYANFTNSYVFGVILQTHPEITKRIIELSVPDLEISEIEMISREERQEVSHYAKMTFLDVTVKLTDGTEVLVEMQVARLTDFIRRIRYYRSDFDVIHLKKGGDYKTLPNVIQIIICCYDPIGEGKYVYDYEFRDKEDGSPLEDNGQRVIFLNSNGKEGPVSDELKDLLTYINGQESHGELIEWIDDSVIDLKYDEDKRTDFMKFEDLLADKLEEGKALGIEQGIALGKEEGIVNSFQMLTETGIQKAEAIQKIADSFHMSESEVSKIIQKADI